jgi:hypothetical protein
VYELAMRNLIVGCVVLLWVAGCGGGGSREAALAKQARYKGDKIQIFTAMKELVNSKYPLQQSDETTLGMVTTARWYTPEGLVATSGAQDIRNLPHNSINLAFLVKQVPDGDSFLVVVEGKILRFIKGSPAPEPRDLKSADLPYWVYSKADQLVLDIHKALAQYEVKAPGGMAPPPTDPAPAPTGDPAPAADPNAGSAAPAPAP